MLIDFVTITYISVINECYQLCVEKLKGKRLTYMYNSVWNTCVYAQQYFET
jgi:hypothetical protein